MVNFCQIQSPRVQENVAILHLVALPQKSITRSDRLQIWYFYMLDTIFWKQVYSSQRWDSGVCGTSLISQSYQHHHLIQSQQVHDFSICSSVNAWTFKDNLTNFKTSQKLAAFYKHFLWQYYSLSLCVFTSPNKIVRNLISLQGSYTWA